MNKYIKIILTIILVLLLFVIRAFSEELFYDPLIEYFKNDYLYSKIPKIDVWHLMIDMLFRYILNSLVSLGIIWVLFERKDYLKFTGFFLMAAFTVLIIAFVLLLRNQFENGYLLPFYIRRFIIHPLFLLLLLPAFYYQKLSNR
ncbi:exosortase F system-associated protein [Polaribacter aestuariivivens]|uniref:Exosortase F system-associated protein n=1 Tax=Polaribacter aestuariivivens TaxID=2304626 RepID=A0A5S3N3W3_9FLAO|nr:exosortase F system-associated protein [Polaribacter aestuariivivens]TMM30038.1 exosortase F system-associated protein [Polaribacter aestuariivivens]